MTTQIFQVADGNDDADQRGDGADFVLGGTSIEARASTVNSERSLGMRFQSVGVPKGDIIDSATWQPYFTSATNDDPECTIYAEDVADADDFGTTQDVVGRTKTTANVAWSDSGLGSGFQDSPDCKALIQEVVDGADWASLNALVIIAEGSTGADKRCSMRAEEGNGSQAGKLSITHSASRRRVGIGAGYAIRM